MMTCEKCKNTFLNKKMVFVRLCIVEDHLDSGDVRKESEHVVWEWCLDCLRVKLKNAMKEAVKFKGTTLLIVTIQRVGKCQNAKAVKKSILAQI